MRQLAFGDLTRLHVLQSYETAFRKATGVVLKVASPDELRQRLSFGEAENPFCTLVAGTPGGCEACRQTQARVHRGVARRLLTQQGSCFAGLTEVAVPVVIGGHQVATLMSGQVFRREPTARDFAMVVQMLSRGQDADWEKRARQAYFTTPVVTADRFQAIVQLLTMFAQYLADYAGRHLIASSDDEPAAVVGAKQFVQTHIEEPISLTQVVQHVHVSRFYFCKLFKKATGMTLTDYVSRVRLEKAKTLLADPSLRISEVVFAAGFGSIPRFNSVFKRQVGMAPTQYRATLRSPSPA
jgi:AraC-like DNA-binding protein